ncbi:MAG: hypothetical protein ISP83_07660 [Candidatus Poseidonia sp.]|nr:hypothetical protein [Poseidonia sp.]
MYLHVESVLAITHSIEVVSAVDHVAHGVAELNESNEPKDEGVIAEDLVKRPRIRCRGPDGTEASQEGEVGANHDDAVSESNVAPEGGRRCRCNIPSVASNDVDAFTHTNVHNQPSRTHERQEEAEGNHVLHKWRGHAPKDSIHCLMKRLHGSLWDVPPVGGNDVYTPSPVQGNHAEDLLQVQKRVRQSNRCVLGTIDCACPIYSRAFFVGRFNRTTERHL